MARDSYIFIIDGQPCQLYYCRHSEYNYLEAIQQILDRGVQKCNRTGTDTLSIFGMQMRYNLRDGKINSLHSG